MHSNWGAHSAPSVSLAKIWGFYF